ncbi:AEC family transporter [Bacteroidota bacterium]
MEDLIYIFNVVSPVFLLVLLGLSLRFIGLISESFVSITSKFVFNVSLPVLVFLKLYTVDLSRTFDIEFVLFIVLGTILLFSISWIMSFFVMKKPVDRGVFIQGSFRSNYVIVGLAIILGMLGDAALKKASLLIPFLLPIYNLLSVLVLNIYENRQYHTNLGKLIRDIIFNPLILGVIVALPFAIFKLEIYSSLKTTGEYLAGIALPLALIGIGGSMNLKIVKTITWKSVISSIIKIVFAPLLFTIIGIWIGFTGNDLGIIFIIFGCPTAIASFVMAVAMGGDGKLAGNIIVISTLGSLITITSGLFLLRIFNLI